MITVCLFIIILFHVAPSNNNDIRLLFLQSQVYIGKCVHLSELPGVVAPENENVVLNAKSERIQCGISQKHEEKTRKQRPTAPILESSSVGAFFLLKGSFPFLL